MIKDFVSLIYPHLCHACGKSLYGHERGICMQCQFQLPETDFHLDPENKVSQLFWGKVNIENGAAYYHFAKGGKVQRLIHQLKYKGKTEVGNIVGEMYGRELLKAEAFQSIDCVLPVPLHPKKQRKRGYNQSDFFAEGLATSLGINFYTEVLVRKTATDSQTRKSVFDRWVNVDSIFEVMDPDALRGKHILLVDDVVTTGSTLESSAAALLEVPDTKVSVATIAYAN